MNMKIKKLGKDLQNIFLFIKEIFHVGIIILEELLQLLTYLLYQIWVENKIKPENKSLKQQRKDIKNVMKKIKTSQSGQKKDGKKVSKKDAGLNCIGYPHDDPYGLIAAFKLAFGFNTKK